MVCIISIGKIDKYLSILFIGLLSTILIFTVYIQYPHFIFYPCIICILTSLSMCISIFPFLISTLKSKNKVESEKYIAKLKKFRFRKFLLIIISSFLDFIQTLVHIILYVQMNKYWIIDIIIINIFSYYIFKARLYRHHYLSIIIILLFNIFLFYYNLRNYQFNFSHLLFDILLEVFLSFILVINK